MAKRPDDVLAEALSKMAKIQEAVRKAAEEEKRKAEQEHQKLKAQEELYKTRRGVV
jgi:hypothetical protein